jgi:hypothetical protein
VTPSVLGGYNAKPAISPGRRTTCERGRQLAFLLNEMAAVKSDGSRESNSCGWIKERLSNEVFVIRAKVLKASDDLIKLRNLGDDSKHHVIPLDSKR